MQLFFPLSSPILARSEEKATDDDGGRRRRREEAANSKSCKHSPDAHRRSYSTCSRGSSVTIVHLHPCLWPSVGECGVRMWIRYGWVSPLSTQPSFRVCCPLSTRSTSGKKKKRKEGRKKREEKGKWNAEEDSRRRSIHRDRGDNLSTTLTMKNYFRNEFVNRSSKLGIFLPPLPPSVF